MTRERRLCPRTEFHHPAIINGTKPASKIMNLSTGGVFIQTSNASRFEEGKQITLFTKFPLETRPIRIKARVVHVGNEGIGVEFQDLWGRESEAVETTFEVFKNTLPLPGT
ncbi:MAG: PilZ domain-containing protein [Deltaproteobacteria bacterium]|nr:PilZ domain-containing protein [Deltaproteobacteria bacterium]